MKIAMFMQRLSVRGIRQVKYLSKLEHNIFVFTNRFPSCLSNVTLPVRSRIHFIGPSRSIAFQSSQFAIQSFFSALKNLEIDIIQIFNDPSQRVSVLIAFLEKISGIPVVVDMTEHIVEGCISRRRGKFKVYEEKIYELLLYKLAKKIFILSELKKETLPHDFQRKSVYIPNAADTDLFERRDLEDKSSEIKTKVDADYILFYEEPIVGEQIERIKLMLNSFMLLKAKSSAKIKLLLVGRDDISFRNLIRKKHMEKLVYLAGEIGYDQIPAYVKAADIGLAPYPKNLLLDLGLGNKVFDYWCASKPVVITPVKTMALITRQYNAGIAVQENAQSMANGILKLIEDPSYAKELGNNGRRLVEDFFNWNVQARRIVEAYKECLMSQ